MPEIIQQRHWEIYRDKNFYSAFPSVCRIGESFDDDILIAFRRAPDHRWLTEDDITPSDPAFSEIDHMDSRSHICVYRLSPDFKAKSGPAMLSSHPQAADQDPNLLTLKNGQILLTGFLWYPITPTSFEKLTDEAHLRARLFGNPDLTGVRYLLWGCYSRLSHLGKIAENLTSDGVVWSDHQLFPKIPGSNDTVPGRWPFFGGAQRGQSIELADGTLLTASYGVLNFADRRSNVHIYRSTDQGKNWVFVTSVMKTLPDDVHLLEPALAQWPNGKITLFCRSGGAGGQLVCLDSLDSGENWENFKVHQVTGHPFHPLSLTDGRIFLSYGYRSEPHGIRARIINQDLDDFGTAEEIILRQDGPGPDLGYPWSIQTGYNQVLTVYYMAGQDGIRHIAASHLTWKD